MRRDALPTAFAKVAYYYRLVFLEGSEAEIEPIRVDLSAFCVPAATSRGADLTQSPFIEHEAEISSPVSYETSQALGRALRAANAEAVRYRSARDPEGGTNLGLFPPRAFTVRRPEELQTG